MRVKGKRIMKNGMEAGYVYYSKEKKWKWRIIGKAKKSKRVQKGGTYDNIHDIKIKYFIKLCNVIKNLTTISLSSLHKIKKDIIKICFRARPSEKIIDEHVTELYNFFIKRREKSVSTVIHKKNKTAICWDEIVNNIYNPEQNQPIKGKELNDQQKVRCDVLYYTLQIHYLNTKDGLLDLFDKFLKVNDYNTFFFTEQNKKQNKNGKQKAVGQEEITPRIMFLYKLLKNMNIWKLVKYILDSDESKNSRFTSGNLGVWIVGFKFTNCISSEEKYWLYY